MSSGSPVRASFTAQKRGGRESSLNRFANLTQKGTDVDSPLLNEESERAEQSQHDLKVKL